MGILIFNYPFSIDLIPNGIPIDAKSIGNDTINTIQISVGLTYYFPPFQHLLPERLRLSA